MNIFVYGTLLPGESRWHILKPYVQGAPQQAQVEGVLFNMGSFPALLLDHPDIVSAPVFGMLCAIKPGMEDEIIRILDQIEGYRPHSAYNLYERMEHGVMVDDAFHKATFYVGGEDLTEMCTKQNHIPDGDWRNR